MTTTTKTSSSPQTPVNAQALEVDIRGKAICLFHRDCMDGMAAAVVVSWRFPHAEFHAVDYGDEIPCDISPWDTVIVVDFSFNVKKMDQLVDLSDQLVFLDHHGTSRPTFDYLLERQAASAPDAPIKKDVYIHDTKRSGALLAWDAFFPDQTVPPILRHISDRDLWHFELPETKAIMAGLSAWPLDLTFWRTNLSPLTGPRLTDNLIEEGRIIERYNAVMGDMIIAQTCRRLALIDEVVPVINCPRILTSETVGKLSLDVPYAIGYYDEPDVRVFSLRSRKVGGTNVRLLAESMGGGGHDTAAGFRVPRDHPLAQI